MMKTLQVEQLESRNLLSAGGNHAAMHAAAAVADSRIQFDDGALVVVGTKGNDYCVAREYNDYETGVRTLQIELLAGGKYETFEAPLVEVHSITFYGFQGNDYFENRTNIDATAFGGSGNDVLLAAKYTAHNQFFGGSGNDLLIGSFGVDYLDGGPGQDFVRPGSSAGDTILNAEADVTLEQAWHDYASGF